MLRRSLTLQGFSQRKGHSAIARSPFALALCLIFLSSALCPRSFAGPEWADSSIEIAYRSANTTSQILDSQLDHVNKAARQSSPVALQIDARDIVRKLEGLHYIVSRLEGGQPGQSWNWHYADLASYDLIARTYLLEERIIEVFRVKPTREQQGRSRYTQEELFELLNDMEAKLLTLENPITPEDVLNIAAETRRVIEDRCENKGGAEPLLVMGKRPKDVYTLLYTYLQMLQEHTRVELPEMKPGRILPQDVFDLATISLMTTSLLAQGSRLGNWKGGFPEKISASPVTPSHVYRQVLSNTNLLSSCKQKELTVLAD